MLTVLREIGDARCEEFRASGRRRVEQQAIEAPAAGHDERLFPVVERDSR